MLLFFVFGLLAIPTQRIHGLPLDDEDASASSFHNDDYLDDDEYYSDDGEYYSDSDDNSRSGHERAMHFQPEFVSKPTDETINEGDTIKLPCYVDNMDNLVLIWKRGTSIIAIGKSIMDKSDARVKLETEKTGSTLIISLAEPADAGDYTCQLSSSKPIEQKHKVEIRVAPQIRSVPSSGVLVVQQGESANLDCEVTKGSPEPRVFWRRKERKMRSGELEIQGDSLTLRRASRHDSGIYICRADNGFGGDKPAEVEIKLDVQHKPLVEQEQTFIHTRENDETEVICLVHASPRAEVSWLKNGHPLERDQGIVSVRGNRHTLLLPGIKESTFGQYKCVATNQIGSDEGVTDVSGLASPANVKSDPFGLEKNSFWLDWTAESITPISEFQIQWRSEGSSTWSPPMPSEKKPPRHNGDHTYEGWLTLKGLEPVTHYEARIKSRNAYGWNEYAEIFTFGTKGAELYKKNARASGNDVDSNEKAPLQQPSTGGSSLLKSSFLFLLPLLPFTLMYNNNRA